MPQVLVLFCCLFVFLQVTWEACSEPLLPRAQHCSSVSSLQRSLMGHEQTQALREQKKKVPLRGRHPWSPAKSFPSSPTKKNTSENCPAICQHLRPSLCLTVGHHNLQKKWPSKTAKLHRSWSSERHGDAWLPCFQSPAATVLSSSLQVTSPLRELCKSFSTCFLLDLPAP